MSIYKKKDMSSKIGIKNILHGFLREKVLMEVDLGGNHPEKRVKDRILDSNLNNVREIITKQDGFTDQRYFQLLRDIELVKRIDFPKGKRFAIILYTSPSDERGAFVYDGHRPEERSTGNQIVLIIDNNIFFTLTYHRRSEQITNVKTKIGIDTIKSYLEDCRKKNLKPHYQGLVGSSSNSVDLSLKSDISIKSELDFEEMKTGSCKEKNDAIKLDGEWWKLNRKEGKLYRMNKIKDGINVKSVDEFINELSDEDAFNLLELVDSNS